MGFGFFPGHPGEYRECLPELSTEHQRLEPLSFFCPPLARADLMRDVIGRIIAPKAVHDVNPRTCAVVGYMARGMEVADGIKEATSQLPLK